MFDWFWEFLYGISKSLLRLIDGLIACINKLCGIDPITINGEETDFISFFLRSEGVAKGFKISAILGLVVLVFFAIFRILIIITKEKQDMSPRQVCMKAFQSIMLFLFVPAMMIILVYVLNTFMQALYLATSNGSQSLGTFLFGSFSQDAVVDSLTYENILNSTSLYMDTDLVSTAIELSDFDFIFSWISGICLLICIGNCLIVFVDRAISIAVLFIVSPFSIASSVLDDGGRFKLWRDQVISKFLVGYGMILFLNVYCLLINVITPSSVVFFDTTFLNGLFKLIIILGGGYASMKSMALIGNIISSGAGSRDMIDAALGSKAISAAGLATKPFRWGAGKAWKAFKDRKKGDDKDKKNDDDDDSKKSDDGNDDSSGEKLNKNPKFNNNGKDINNALKNNNGKDDENGKGDNQNNEEGNPAPVDNGQGDAFNGNANQRALETIQEVDEDLEGGLREEDDDDYYDDLR